MKRLLIVVLFTLICFILLGATIEPKATQADNKIPTPTITPTADWYAVSVTVEGVTMPTTSTQDIKISAVSVIDMKTNAVILSKGLKLSDVWNMFKNQSKKYKVSSISIYATPTITPTK